MIIFISLIRLTPLDEGFKRIDVSVCIVYTHVVTEYRSSPIETLTVYTPRSVRDGN